MQAKAVYLVDFAFGIKNGSSAVTTDPNSVGWGFTWKNVFNIWIPALLVGTLFLGISEIICLLERYEEPV